MMFWCTCMTRYKMESLGKTLETIAELKLKLENGDTLTGRETTKVERHDELQVHSGVYEHCEHIVSVLNCILARKEELQAMFTILFECTECTASTMYSQCTYRMYSIYNVLTMYCDN